MRTTAAAERPTGVRVTRRRCKTPGDSSSTSWSRRASTARPRDQEHVAGPYKHLTFRGVTLPIIGEGEISELHVGLKGTMSALYLKDLAQKTRRSLERRVRQDRSAGGISYGYWIAPAIARRAHDRRTEIDPKEAAVIRNVFAAFASGKSPRAIAKDLNERGRRRAARRTLGRRRIRSSRSSKSRFVTSSRP
jgi:DNA invertase Pin-like site-specific DNA recombinase